MHYHKNFDIASIKIIKTLIVAKRKLIQRANVSLDLWFEKDRKAIEDMKEIAKAKTDLGYLSSHCIGEQYNYTSPKHIETFAI